MLPLFNSSSLNFWFTETTSTENEHKQDSKNWKSDFQSQKCSLPDWTHFFTLEDKILRTTLTRQGKSSQKSSKASRALMKVNREKSLKSFLAKTSLITPWFCTLTVWEWKIHWSCWIPCFLKSLNWEFYQSQHNTRTWEKTNQPSWLTESTKARN